MLLPLLALPLWQLRLWLRLPLRQLLKSLLKSLKSLRQL